MDWFARKTRGIHRLGTRAAQPAATDVYEGTYYYVTDEGKVERSNGATWDIIAAATLEGNWTPTDNSGAGLSFASAAGSYIKIGRQVILVGDVTYPATASVANASWAGVPFSAVTSSIGGYASLCHSNQTAVGPMVANILSGANTIGFFQTGSGVSSGFPVRNVDLTGRIVRFDLPFRASA